MTVRRRIGHFLADDRGSYAIEFAMVSGLFVIVILAIMQYAMFFMARQGLDAALQRGVRSLATGGFQRSTATLTKTSDLLAALQAKICAEDAQADLKLFDCRQVKLDVKVVSDFSGGPFDSALDAQTGDWSTSAGTSYSCPKPHSIVLLRGSLKFPLFASPFGFSLGRFFDGSALIQSASAFRVESYIPPTAGAC
ncbi:TadE/TadG family type IV pilus assembly protein [Methylobacterium gossipiicola]|uniref:TadE-like protein n=1 Tax=Methylobacterium gossipiicola TaxID=582675 RepID=A0A1I2RXX4_9HYPH|nr:TadE family protein [Methylobacterium gossipiicola]SFG44913.1 TadE-like protein [Methylobacterium gossipiicola]